MREILFKAKRLDNGEWVEGWYIHTKRHHCIITGCVDDGYVVYGHCASDVAMYVVDPETVGQYTGRKDINSKKVFEHDILQFYIIWADGTKEKSARVIVQWSENDQCYVLTTIEGHLYDDFGSYSAAEYYEVIGNIHDNPELLEVNK